ncbi:MAG: hypothetical protein LQ339_004401 [Xanthoria mediterranea]|nr:MAG: hypothetical protein LQ339_004401 [Xanthoria mediterranea]
MSHYLSSFLIEPVVRQARRFSRQNTDDRPFRPVDIHPPAEQGAEIHQSTPWVHPEAVAPETSWQRLPDQHSPEESERATARYSEEPSDAEVRAWRDVHRPLGISHEESLAAVFSPDSTLPNDQFSSNPVHSVAESLRSTTSSLSDPAHFAMDSDAMEVHGSAQSSMQHHPPDANNPSVQTGDGALPEDDGMTAKRRQIVAIHNTRSSNTEKARLVHSLMNERYSSLQPNLQTPHPPSPLTLASHAKPNPSTSGHTGSTIAPSTFPPVSLSVSSETNDLFNLSVEDLKPTYHQKPEVHRTSSGPGNRSSNRLSQESLPEYKVLGCPHYKRNIKLQCSECHRWYTCRFCHDEVENHCLNRPETKNMLCMFCGCAQPASGECTRCGEQSARYYCGVCKFWDNSPGKSIYHCNDCGICRIGEGLGKDFFHCKTCNACLSIRTMENHRCIERSTDCDCPICGEYMFTSPQTVVFMRCGHAIHHFCYYEHAKRSYRCPICSKSMANMEAQFRQIERSIESQPMPPEYQDAKAWVYCNDCNAKSSVKYHWLDATHTTRLRYKSFAVPIKGAFLIAPG